MFIKTIEWTHDDRVNRPSISRDGYNRRCFRRQKSRSLQDLDQIAAESEENDDGSDYHEDPFPEWGPGRRKTVATLPANAVDPQKVFEAFQMEERKEKLERSRRANALLLANFTVGKKACDREDFLKLKKVFGIDQDLDSVSVSSACSESSTSHFFSDDDDDEGLEEEDVNFGRFLR